MITPRYRFKGAKARHLVVGNSYNLLSPERCLLYHWCVDVIDGHDRHACLSAMRGFTYRGCSARPLPGACLINAGLAGSTVDDAQQSPAQKSPAPLAQSRKTSRRSCYPTWIPSARSEPRGDRLASSKAAGPAAGVSREEFERAVVELGIIERP